MKLLLDKSVKGVVIISMILRDNDNIRDVHADQYTRVYHLNLHIKHDN